MAHPLLEELRCVRQELDGQVGEHLNEFVNVEPIFIVGENGIRTAAQQLGKLLEVGHCGAEVQWFSATHRHHHALQRGHQILGCLLRENGVVTFPRTHHCKVVEDLTELSIATVSVTSQALTVSCIGSNKPHLAAFINGVVCQPCAYRL